jgi:DNA-directed RNA polymerase subunit beta'
VEPTEEAKAAMYSMTGYDSDAFADYGAFGSSGGQAVPLEEYDFGNYSG